MMFKKKRSHGAGQTRKYGGEWIKKRLTLSSLIRKQDFCIIQIGKHSTVILGRKLRKPRIPQRSNDVTRWITVG